MSLVENLILVVTVVFSNGDTIDFEIGASMYCYRVKAHHKELRKPIEEARVMLEGRNCLYSFQGNEGEYTSTLMPLTAFFDTSLQSLLSKGEIDMTFGESSIVRIDKPLIGSLYVSSYFLKDKRIEEEISKSKFLQSLLGSSMDMLWLYAEYYPNEDATGIVEVKVDWASHVSKDLAAKLKMIE